MEVTGLSLFHLFPRVYVAFTTQRASIVIAYDKRECGLSPRGVLYSQPARVLTPVLSMLLPSDEAVRPPSHAMLTTCVSPVRGLLPQEHAANRFS